MPGDGLSLFNCATILKVGSDPSCAKAVTTNLSRHFCIRNSAFDHSQCVSSRQLKISQNVGTSHGGAEEGSRTVGFKPRTCQICVKKLLCFVVGWHFVKLSTLFVKSYPGPLSELVIVLDRHIDDGADAGKGEDHGADECSIAKPDKSGAVDTVEELPRFIGRKHWRLAAFDNVFRSANRSGGIGRNDLSGHKPVETHADCRQMLLDCWRRIQSRQIFDIGCDADRCNLIEPIAREHNCSESAFKVRIFRCRKRLRSVLQADQY